MQSEKIGNIRQAGSVGFIGKLGGTEQIVRRNRSEEIAGVLPVLNISFYGAAKVLWSRLQFAVGFTIRLPMFGY